MNKKLSVVENFHGTNIYDPYRWLEDLDSEDTKAFINSHNISTQKYVKDYDDYENIKNRMNDFFKRETHSAPNKQGDYFYFRHNDGTQNQSSLYRAKDLNGEKELLIDPNTLSKDGTVALSNYSINKAKDILAYCVSEKGSDWHIVKLYDMKNKTHLSDELRWCRFTEINWLADNESFIYNRFPSLDEMDESEASYHSMACIHRLGTSQEDDKFIIDGKERSPLSSYVGVTEDKEYLILIKSDGTSPLNLFFYRSINDKTFINLFENKKASWNFIGNIKNNFYFQTTYKAPKNRIIEVDINNPNEEFWREIISEGDPISASIVSENYIFICRMKHAHDSLELYDLKTDKHLDINPPFIGSISGFGEGEKGKNIYLGFTSFNTPNTIFKFNFNDLSFEKIFNPSVKFNSDDFETIQVFVESKDKTKVPMFICYKKGLELNGNNKTLLYGYGGFNVSLTPFFDSSSIVWMERGGVFAIANIRGGGEYGENWHEAGMLDKKQNCFDDFIACGEWLINNNYTRKEKLAIEGGSNGGLLTGACLVQRPDLFGAVITDVGVLDMLRYHKFTIGRYWINEYGDPENDAEAFKYIIKYSPLHNIRSGIVYPPILVITSDHDNRVLPCHSYKFVATLEDMSSGHNPILLRVETNAGHGHGKPIAKIIEERADVYSFLEKTLG